MKIDKVLLSSDDNPMYLDFWPIVSKVWKEVFFIEPVLLYFGDKEVDNSYGEILRFENNNEHPTYLKTIWSRYWYPQKEPDTTFMIGDIDMIPLSRYYFIDSIYNIDNDKYVHLAANFDPLPSCYHVAKGSKFKEVLELPEDFEEVLKLPEKFSHKPTMIETGDVFSLWGSDESYGSYKVSEFYKKNPDTFAFANRNFKTDRMCRTNWRFNLHDKNFNLNQFYDCHSLRPYNQFKNNIDLLIKRLYEMYNIKKPE